MEKIASFTIDHLRLNRGVYVSRRDEVGGDSVTTFDVRMKLPNREPVLGQGAIHTIEHLAATFLRNHPVWGPRIVYWGPMGCLTGCYLIMKGAPDPEKDLLPLMLAAFRHLRDYEGEIPGASAVNCGNFRLHDLAMAKWEAKRFLAQKWRFAYPKTRRIEAKGKTFFDA